MVGIYIGDLDASGGTQKYGIALANFVSETLGEISIFTNREIAPFYSLNSGISVKKAKIIDLILFQDPLIVLDLRILEVIWPRFLVGKRLIIWQHTAIMKQSSWAMWLGKVSGKLCIVCITNYQRRYLKYKDLCVIVRNPYQPILKIENVRRDIDFLAIGSLYEIKGFDLVEKISECAELKHYNFTVAGLDKGHPVVNYIGKTKKVAELFNRSKVYLLLSRTEVWPTVFFEAIGSGLIVVINTELEFLEEVNESIMKRVVRVTIGDIESIKRGVYKALELAGSMSRPDESLFISKMEWKKWEGIIK